MAKSSINFRPVLATSEAHNTRTAKLDYILDEYRGNHQSWTSSSISDMRKHIERECKRISGRKLQKNAEPIREAVVNLNANHTMEDLQELGKRLEEKFGMKCFQIHIHRDEGHRSIDDGSIVINHHAHMVFGWQDPATGKTLKHDRLQYSQMQTLVAETLAMERGKHYSNINDMPERLEAVEFKKMKALEDVKELEQMAKHSRDELYQLEQKKNAVTERIRRLTEAGAAADQQELSEERKEAIRRIVLASTDDFISQESKLSEFEENELDYAIKGLERTIQRYKGDVEDAQRAISSGL